MKTKYNDKTDATILLEQEIAYDTLVKVMDTVRVFPVPGSKWDVAELSRMSRWETRRHDALSHQAPPQA